MGSMREVAVVLLEKLAQTIQEGESMSSGFACNNGPNLRTLLDSAAIYPDDQRIYCLYQTFTVKSRTISLKTLGILPTDTGMNQKEDAEYILLVRVIAALGENVTLQCGDREVILRPNDVLIGTYNPHKRFGVFHHLS